MNFFLRISVQQCLIFVSSSRWHVITLLLWKRSTYLNTYWWNESHYFEPIVAPLVSVPPQSLSTYLSVCEGVRSMEQRHQAHSNCAALYEHYRVILLSEGLEKNCIFASQQQKVPFTFCAWYCDTKNSVISVFVWLNVMILLERNKEWWTWYLLKVDGLRFW